MVIGHSFRANDKKYSPMSIEEKGKNLLFFHLVDAIGIEKRDLLPATGDNDDATSPSGKCSVWNAKWKKKTLCRRETCVLCGARCTLKRPIWIDNSANLEIIRFVLAYFEWLYCIGRWYLWVRRIFWQRLRIHRIQIDRIAFFRWYFFLVSRIPCTLCMFSRVPCSPVSSFSFL